jgi:hypothetical protein
VDMKLPGTMSGALTATFEQCDGYSWMDRDRCEVKGITWHEVPSQLHVAKNDHVVVER